MRARTQPETSRINKLLQTHGLGRLEDRGTVSQLGYLVKDHEHFRRMLEACEPAERPAMYDAMSPSLRFPAKPLDVYLAETRAKAEREQLPILMADGSLRAFNPTEISSQPPALSDQQKHELAIAQNAIAAAGAPKTLTLICARCTKAASFPGTFTSDCARDAYAAGWRRKEGKDYCPECA